MEERNLSQSNSKHIANNMELQLNTLLHTFIKKTVLKKENRKHLL